ncbi:MAG: crotonyl-CoA carboxylase/reductase, partial [Gaiellaceae bacterium]|nr:crotonyl-CoA carboxylase/reductase [Gaiellaceae bacterium]
NAIAVVSSEEKAKIVRALGATAVIDRREFELEYVDGEHNLEDIKLFGKVVICAGTTGFDLDFDVRYLWMRQKQIIGSHFCNAYQAWQANELVIQKKIEPVLWRTLGFDEVPKAHQIMRENTHVGKMVCLVGAAEQGLGRAPDA